MTAAVKSEKPAVQAAAGKVLKTVDAAANPKAETKAVPAVGTPPEPDTVRKSMVVPKAKNAEENAAMKVAAPSHRDPNTTRTDGGTDGKTSAKAEGKPASEVKAAASRAKPIEPMELGTVKKAIAAQKAETATEDATPKIAALPRQDIAPAKTNGQPDALPNMVKKPVADPIPAPGAKTAATVEKPPKSEKPGMAKATARVDKVEDPTPEAAPKIAALTDREPDTAKSDGKPTVAALGGFRLQLGSFRSLDGAKSMRDRILKVHGDLLRGLRLVVETVTVPDRGDFFRVNSQPVPNRDGIDETCLKLAIRDVPCLLVRAP